MASDKQKETNEEIQSYGCELCKVSYHSQKDLKEHLWSLIHHTKIEDQKRNSTHVCTLCLTECTTIPEYRKHLLDKRHKRALEKFNKAEENGKSYVHSDSDEEAENVDCDGFRNDDRQSRWNNRYLPNQPPSLWNFPPWQRNQRHCDNFNWNNQDVKHRTRHGNYDSAPWMGRNDYSQAENFNRRNWTRRNNNSKEDFENPYWHSDEDWRTPYPRPLMDTETDMRPWQNDDPHYDSYNYHGFQQRDFNDFNINWNNTHSNHIRFSDSGGVNYTGNASLEELQTTHEDVSCVGLDETLVNSQNFNREKRISQKVHQCTATNYGESRKRRKDSASRKSFLKKKQKLNDHASVKLVSSKRSRYNERKKKKAEAVCQSVTKCTKSSVKNIQSETSLRQCRLSTKRQTKASKQSFTADKMNTSSSSPKGKQHPVKAARSSSSPVPKQKILFDPINLVAPIPPGTISEPKINKRRVQVSKSTNDTIQAAAAVKDKLTAALKKKPEKLQKPFRSAVTRKSTPSVVNRKVKNVKKKPTCTISSTNYAINSLDSSAVSESLVSSSSSAPRETMEEIHPQLNLLSEVKVTKRQESNEPSTTSEELPSGCGVNLPSRNSKRNIAASTSSGRTRHSSEKSIRQSKSSLTRETLVKLVNSPRSRKDRMQLASMLRNHAQSQTKLSSTRISCDEQDASPVSQDLAGLFETLSGLEKQVPTIKIEDLTPEIQLKIAQLIEDDSELGEIENSLLDVIKDKDSQKDLTSLNPCQEVIINTITSSSLNTENNIQKKVSSLVRNTNISAATGISSSNIVVSTDHLSCRNTPITQPSTSKNSTTTHLTTSCTSTSQTTPTTAEVSSFSSPQPNFPPHPFYPGQFPYGYLPPGFNPYHPMAMFNPQFNPSFNMFTRMRNPSSASSTGPDRSTPTPSSTDATAQCDNPNIPTNFIPHSIPNFNQSYSSVPVPCSRESVVKKSYRSQASSPVYFCDESGTSYDIGTDNKPVLQTVLNLTLQEEDLENKLKTINDKMNDLHNVMEETINQLKVCSEDKNKLKRQQNILSSRRLQILKGCSLDDVEVIKITPPSRHIGVQASSPKALSNLEDEVDITATEISETAKVKPETSTMVNDNLQDLCLSIDKNHEKTDKISRPVITHSSNLAPSCNETNSQTSLTLESSDSNRVIDCGIIVEESNSTSDTHNDAGSSTDADSQKVLVVSLDSTSSESPFNKIQSTPMKNTDNVHENVVTFPTKKFIDSDSSDKMVTNLFLSPTKTFGSVSPVKNMKYFRQRSVSESEIDSHRKSSGNISPNICGRSVKYLGAITGSPDSASVIRQLTANFSGVTSVSCLPMDDNENTDAVSGQSMDDDPNAESVSSLPSDDNQQVRVTSVSSLPSDDNQQVRVSLPSDDNQQVRVSLPSDDNQQDGVASVSCLPSDDSQAADSEVNKNLSDKLGTQQREFKSCSIILEKLDVNVNNEKVGDQKESSSEFEPSSESDNNDAKREMHRAKESSSDCTPDEGLSLAEIKHKLQTQKLLSKSCAQPSEQSVNQLQCDRNVEQSVNQSHTSELMESIDITLKEDTQEISGSGVSECFKEPKECEISQEQSGSQPPTSQLFQFSDNCQILPNTDFSQYSLLPVEFSDSESEDSDLLEIGSGYEAYLESVQQAANSTANTGSSNVKRPRLSKAFDGPKLTISGIEFDNENVYICYRGYGVKRYSEQNGELLKEYDTEDNTINCMALGKLPNGKTILYMAGIAFNIMAYDVENCKVQCVIDVMEQVKCLHSDYGHVYGGLVNGMLEVVNIQNNKKVDTYQSDDQCIHCITSAREGAFKLLCVSSQDATITVYDAFSGLPVRVLDGHTKTSFSVQVDMSKVYSGSGDKTVMVHDLHTGELEYIYRDAKGMVTSVEIAGDLLFVASYDRLVRCYDTETQALKCLYYGAGQRVVSKIAFHQSRLYTGNRDGEILTIDLNHQHLWPCQCGNCKHVFGIKDHLLYHVIGDHIEPNSFMTKCTWRSCKQWFSTQRDTKNFESHMRNHLESIDV